MQRSVRGLKREAREATDWRGHHMRPWELLQSSNSREVWQAVCGVCGKSVQIDTNPPANGIDIGGEAVALNCRGMSIS